MPCRQREAAILMPTAVNSYRTDKYFSWVVESLGLNIIANDGCSVRFSLAGWAGVEAAVAPQGVVTEAAFDFHHLHFRRHEASSRHLFPAPIVKKTGFDHFGND